MADPATITTAVSASFSFIKKYWKQFLIVFFIAMLIPPLIITTVINMLFPQLSEEKFETYKSLTEKTDINWTRFMAYDTVRLDNDHRENKPNESVFDLLKVKFIEYEIIEKEEIITKTVNGKKVTITVITKEYIPIKDIEIHGYDQIKELLTYLNYPLDKKEITVKEINDFLSEVDKREKYKIQTKILTDEEITEDFDEKHRQWYSALIEILPLIDPTAEFSPDEYIIPDIATQNPSVPSIWPTNGRITSEFGEYRITHTHKGIDISNITGTPVCSTAAGTVIAAGLEGNYGKRIMIYHGTDENANTYITIYAHLSQLKVSVGDKVSQGDTIGFMGSTGHSTGPHLHYEIRLNGEPINPRHFLS